jgi:hypothetical protein
MIQQKLKICKGCKTDQKIWSHGYCNKCWSIERPVNLKRSPIKSKTKVIHQDGIILSEKAAFLVAYKKRGERWFLSGERVSIEELTASNFSHLLAKGQNKFPLFKYYWKNILILQEDEHYILDNGTEKQVSEFIGELTPYEAHRWGVMMQLRDELILEYAEWSLNNYKKYKL